VLIVAEPLANVSAQQLRALFAADRVLLVLPKWGWGPSPDTPGWIAGAAPLPVGIAKTVAQAAVADADVVRVPAVATWSKNEVGGEPSVTDKLQLIKSARLRPVVGTADGMLIGELRTG